MYDVNTIFCRVLLARTLATIPPKTRATIRAWGITCSGSGHRKHYFVEGSPSFRNGKQTRIVWEGEADNAYDARYQAAVAEYHLNDEEI